MGGTNWEPDQGERGPTENTHCREILSTSTPPPHTHLGARQHHPHQCHTQETEPSAALSLQLVAALLSWSYGPYPSCSHKTPVAPYPAVQPWPCPSLSIALLLSGPQSHPMKWGSN